MSQESVLRVGVDSSGAESGANRASAAMRRMSAQADIVSTSFTQLQRGANAFGAQTSAALAGVDARTRQAVGGVNALSAAFMGLSAAFAVRSVVEFLDSTTNMDNRLRLVTHDTAQLNAVYAELLRLSNATRTPLAENAALYNRMAFATRGLALSYRETVSFVETLNQAVVISGATTSEAAGAMLQLSQGLASGTLRGQELNSVMEQMPKVALTIAAGMGVTIGELRKLGEAGKITAVTVVDAMKKAAPDLAKEYQQVSPTISGAFVVMKNNVLDFVRTVNNSNGVGRAFASVMLGVADNIRVVAGAASALSVVVVARVVPAVVSMGAAFLATPFGAVVAAVTAVGGALGALSEMSFKVGNDSVTGSQLMVAAWRVVASSVASAWEWLRTTWLGDWVSKIGSMAVALGDFFALVFSIIGTIALGTVNKFVGVWVGAFESVRAVWGQLPALFEYLLKSVANLVIVGLEKIVNTFVAALASIGYAVDYFTDLGLGDKITSSMHVDLGKLNTDEAAAVLTSTGAAISSAFSDSMSVDYIGDAGTVVAESYTKNLKAVVAESAKVGDAQDVLGAKFNTVAQDAKKASEGVDTFKNALQKAFDSARDAGGQSVAVAEEWYTKEKATLAKLGLEHTKYATMLETVFVDKMKAARTRDLENATDWASGVQRALNSLSSQYGNNAKIAETLFTSSFDKMADALTTFVTTGKLNFREFATSILADIAKIIVKMMLLNAVKSAMGFGGGGFFSNVAGSAGGGLAGLIPGFATGGSFTVSGKGGSDSNLVAFNATRGERVTVETPAQQRDNAQQAPLVLQMTVNARDASSFKASETQIAAQVRRMMKQAQRRA
jgi:lambda family phage tail tape measure protein